jgi:hypothetical protein
MPRHHPKGLDEEQVSSFNLSFFPGSDEGRAFRVNMAILPPVGIRLSERLVT